MGKIEWKRYKTFNTLYLLAGSVVFLWFALKYSYLVFSFPLGIKGVLIGLGLLAFFGGLSYITYRIAMDNRKKPIQD